MATTASLVFFPFKSSVRYVFRLNHMLQVSVRHGLFDYNIYMFEIIIYSDPLHVS